VAGNPAQPAVIVGTVDMIGSRLLFSGYGPGFKSRPLHAGFLGQDALVVHDEAHLEPAFQQLLEAISSEQKRSNEFATFHVIALTATTRTNAGDRALLSDRDHLNGEVSRRLNAKKSIRVSSHRRGKRYCK
jgi:CRISPR-associated endonuclease/helicase Cas3